MSSFLLIHFLLFIIRNWLLGIDAEEPVDCGYNNQCGHHNLTVVTTDGKNTGQYEYPMIAWVKELTSEDCFKCPAVIISKLYVLATAHCVLRTEVMYELEKSKYFPQKILQPKEIAVVVGDWILNSITENSFATKTYAVKNINTNVNFLNNELSMRQNDIAWIQTVKPIEFGYYASPVCLPFGAEKRKTPFEGSAIALGWNSNDLGDFRIPGGILQKANVKILSNDNCELKYDNPTLCIEFSGEDKDRLICKGWSGGPVLQTNEMGNLEVIGFLMSAFNRCDIQPLHNTITNVHYHLKSIIDETRDAVYCGKEINLDPRAGAPLKSSSNF